MKYVYIAGPLTGSGLVDANIKAALRMAEEVRGRNMTPFVPHLYVFWNFHLEHTEEYWLRLDRDWLSKCDALLVRRGCSPGTDKEVQWGADAGIPLQLVAEDLSDLEFAVTELCAMLDVSPLTGLEPLPRLPIKSKGFDRQAEVLGAMFRGESLSEDDGLDGGT